MVVFLFWVEVVTILMILTFWQDEDENEEEEKYDVKQHLVSKGIGYSFTVEEIREALSK